MAQRRGGSREIIEMPSRFSTASVSRSQRLPANGNASITTGPIFFSTFSRSMVRARCSLVFTVSGFRSENLGGLLDIHALDHAGDEDDAEGFGQFVDRVLDDMLDFTLCHGFFRIV